MEKSEKRRKRHKSKEAKVRNEAEESLIEKLNTRITLGREEVSNDFPVDPLQNPWTMQSFRENFKVEIVNAEENSKGLVQTMEFDMIGIDTSLANAFRRIMLAEVPSMAVDKVLIYNNTTVIPDEVLAHRLGMIPFKADSRLFEMPSADFQKSRVNDEDAVVKVDPRTTLVFKLCIKCKRNPKYKGASTDHNLDEMYIDHNVYSRHIEWVNDYKKLVSGGDDFWSQFTSEDVGPIDDDILIAKLRPGQEIDIEMHCVKGVGKDHAKFQPVDGDKLSHELISVMEPVAVSNVVEILFHWLNDVSTNVSIVSHRWLLAYCNPFEFHLDRVAATVWYRLLPEIILKKPVVGEKAHRLKKCFPSGVIEIENVDGQDAACVADARLDKASREVFRHDDLADLVELRRVKDHFIFTIESVGAMSANNIVTEAIDILMQKCQIIMDEIGKPRR